MKSKSKAPCRNCGDRAEGCHGRCERYNTWVEEMRYKKQTAKSAASVAGYFAAQGIIIDKQWRHKHGKS